MVAIYATKRKAAATIAAKIALLIPTPPKSRRSGPAVLCLAVSAYPGFTAIEP